MATTATLPFSCSSTLQTLTRTLSTRHPLRFPRRRFHCFPSLAAFPRLPHPRHLRRAISASAAPNGASSEGEYDYDLFTIGAGSGGVRASPFASTLYGARAAICEMPFATVSSDDLGGVGGTCVLRGCVPKKLLVYGSKYSHEFESLMALDGHTKLIQSMNGAL